MHRVLAILIIVFCLPGSAFAADLDCSAVPGCDCALPLNEFDPQTTALLSDINGQVDITTDNRYSPADPSVPLDIGDRVVVFDNASAVLTFGPVCSRTLPESSSVTIRSIDGCACAALVAAKTGGTFGFAALGIGTAVLLGTGAVLLIANDDGNGDPVTP